MEVLDDELGSLEDFLDFAPRAMSDDDYVCELRDDTPESEHHAIRMMLASLRYMNECTPANFKAMMKAHPTFAKKTIHVILFPSSSTTMTAGVLASGSAQKDSGLHCTIHRVHAVGDFLILYG
jgi:hypothetical protein